jgi:DNA-binding NtrC family response regulator
MLLGKMEGTEGMSERDIFYKVLIDMKRDVNDLKKVVFGLLEGNLDARNAATNMQSAVVPVSVPVSAPTNTNSTPSINNHNFTDSSGIISNLSGNGMNGQPIIIQAQDGDEDEFQEAISYPSTAETLSLEAQEIEMIKKALNKNHGKRKKAADELGISERTLYRKIKQYELE